MTCGACDPQYHRETAEMRVLGYCAANGPIRIMRETQRLHFMGAEKVHWDLRPWGQVLNRPSLGRLVKTSRRGDRLINSRADI